LISWDTGSMEHRISEGRKNSEQQAAAKGDNADDDDKSQQ